jgi:streptogramin lyase
VKTEEPVPEWSKDGQYRSWEIEWATRFPLALSEMLSPSKPLDTIDAQPLARWGIEINAGWRPILERLLGRLETEIAAQPMDDRDRFRVLQIKEKFGRLTVYLADSTLDMDAVIQKAADESTQICEVCGAPGELKQRDYWWSPRCEEHETWRPGEPPYERHRPAGPGGLVLVSRPRAPSPIGVHLAGATRMPLITKPLASAALLGSLAFGACTGNLDSGKPGQDAGQTGGQAGSQATGGQAGTGGQPPGGSDGSMPVPVTPMKVGLTAIGSVTYFSVGNQAQAVAIGLLLRVSPDDTVRAWPQPAPGGLATSLASDGTGKLWVAQWGSPDSLGRFDTLTHAAATLALPAALARPTVVASDGQGGVWVSGGNEPIVGGLDGPDAVAAVTMESAPAPITISIAGLAVASDGQIFVSDYDRGRIGRAAGSSFVWTDLGGAANAPSGLGADVDGSVWFISLGKPNEIGRVASDGTLATYPLAAPITPISDKSLSTIARAPDGSFWFALPEQQALGRITADGQVTFIVPLASGSYPVGVAFDPSGRLWFTDDTGFGRIDLTSP